MSTKTAPKMKLSTVVLQDWTEHERGWGTRPDGQTIHLTMEDRNEYVAGYNKEFNNEPSAPDEYTAADGDGRPVTVGPKLFQKLVNQTNNSKAAPWAQKGLHVEKNEIADSLKPAKRK